jgi:DNA-binding MarR family transcriptional regulator
LLAVLPTKDWRDSAFRNFGKPQTRVVEQLARGGCVVENRHPEDGRGIDVQLADAGLNRLRVAYPTHLASVRSRIMTRSS